MQQNCFSTHHIWDTERQSYRGLYMRFGRINLFKWSFKAGTARYIHLFVISVFILAPLPLFAVPREEWPTRFEELGEPMKIGKTTWSGIFDGLNLAEAIELCDSFRGRSKLAEESNYRELAIRMGSGTEDFNPNMFPGMLGRKFWTATPVPVTTGISRISGRIFVVGHAHGCLFPILIKQAPASLRCVIEDEPGPEI